MSIILTLRGSGDPEAMERYAREHPDEMKAVIELAQSHGVMAHRFYGSPGQVMVVDEWPDEQSFQQFFAEAQPRIEPMMAAAGMSGQPEVTFWRKLETGDEVGWGG
jgi:hypothetical protein